MSREEAIALLDRVAHRIDVVAIHAAWLREHVAERRPIPALLADYLNGLDTLVGEIDGFYVDDAGPDREGDPRP